MITNRLTQLLEQKRATGDEILDLTVSNPTQVGLSYPAEEILQAIANPLSLEYQPHACGLPLARQAVVDYYQTRAVSISAERVFLTASTSEAYTVLFKLLMEANDSVLVPVPSYPLFEHLAQIECVRPLPYPLYFDGSWHIDLPALRASCEKQTRAIIVVSPNNPTGSFLKEYELKELIEFCQENQLALICDEVFADYLYTPQPSAIKSTAIVEEILTFTLNGLSKILALPQLKLGWIVINGGDKLLREAHTRLEFIMDLALSVATPVQHALPSLLKLAPRIQNELKQRLVVNYHWLQTALSGSACGVLPVEGGWYAILQVPRIISEEELTLALLTEENLLIHPGYFFDFATEAWVVVSLITPPAIFQTGIKRLLRYINGRL